MLTPVQYRKKPVVISAMQFDGSAESAHAIADWVKSGSLPGYDEAMVQVLDARVSLFIPTPEGMMQASAGDFVIRGVKGEHYPCKPDIFDNSYDREDA